MQPSIMTTRLNTRSRGFSLMELMVAMAITTIIVTILVSITSIATDTWNRSRSELRAMRQGKAMVDAISKDFEAMVARRGNNFEWLLAKAEKIDGEPSGFESAGKVDLTFFTAVTDRYNGQIGTANDEGGDVSCVAYRLDYKDPLEANGKFPSYVLKRGLIDPKETFSDLLGKTDLEDAFQSFESEVQEEKNFLCENVYQFTVAFHVEIATGGTGGTTTYETKKILVGGASGMTREFYLGGEGIEVDTLPSGITAEQLKVGRLKAVEVSLTVISDLTADAARAGNVPANRKKKLLAEQSYQYSKLIQVPTS
jgi:prepilin-type N-terminal cleavage/methylation domain-containing protein